MEAYIEQTLAIPNQDTVEGFMQRPDHRWRTGIEDPQVSGRKIVLSRIEEAAKYIGRHVDALKLNYNTIMDMENYTVYGTVFFNLFNTLGHPVVNESPKKLLKVGDEPLGTSGTKAKNGFGYENFFYIMKETPVWKQVDSWKTIGKIALVGKAFAHFPFLNSTWTDVTIGMQRKWESVYFPLDDWRCNEVAINNARRKKQSSMNAIHHQFVGGQLSASEAKYNARALVQAYDMVIIKHSIEHAKRASAIDFNWLDAYANMTFGRAIFPFNDCFTSEDTPLVVFRTVMEAFDESVPLMMWRRYRFMAETEGSHSTTLYRDFKKQIDTICKQVRDSDRMCERYEFGQFAGVRYGSLMPQSLFQT